MHRLFAYTNLARPGLHVRRAGTSIRLFLQLVNGSAGPGWVEFQCELSATVTQPVRFMIFSFDRRTRRV